MRTTLHILTRPPSEQLAALARAADPESEGSVETIDLTGADPDYDALLDRIYQADAILVW